MYEAFYGLREKPFSIQPDPDFLFMSKRHRLAFTMLEYGIQCRVGFSVICGEIGCGKTTLVRKLLATLDASVTVGLVYNTHTGIADLLEWIMLAFGQPYLAATQVERYDRFQQFLLAEYAARRRVVLIVDEAQNLNAGALESLRMLSNINADKDQLLQVILIGQPQLKQLLNRPELHQFAQRVGVDFFIPPLAAPEVALYVQHRLQVAGRQQELFSQEALGRIAQASRGVPRSINILCDTALVYGFSAEAASIDAAMVDEVLQDRREYGFLQDQAQ
ncbi:AAA family ATPase [Ramlibacter monticola]|uniref:AAA family ATPase n=1 Tax=Ramlibacter monticola TaxID=1926872 RepID=A0A937CUH2_9BURK|nr:AAA family ATPase [Ramlibacter monticola]MBL0392027.1 AAA family ATPase [Ramlibacter monticola]